MSCRHALLFASALVFLVTGSTSRAQTTQQQPSSTPTLRVTSSLVFLDVTVLDKKGNPVVTGLTKDDFTITEDKKPQRIFSFEAPELHTMGAEASGVKGQAPVTILVLDLLNSRFEDFAFIRYSVRKFLLAQPDQLASPAEMLVIGNESLDMLQGFTRSRAELLYALDHLPAILPYKHMSGAFFWERFAQSIDALQQIALQNKGVPGRKNIIWVGHGGPSLYLETINLSAKTEEKLREYIHLTTNMLVDSRISLFVIYPGLPVNGMSFNLSAEDAQITIGDSDPFSGDVNFGVLSNETGGKLFFNRNDVDAEIARSQQLGAHYYTLTYQPENVDPNGKFRRVRVALRDASLRVITKAGYYAPDSKAIINDRQQHMIKLSDAIEAALPFSALQVSLSNLVRHPDTRTVEATVILNSKHLEFLPDDNGKYTLSLLVAAASLNNDRSILASHIQHAALVSTTQDVAKLPPIATRFQITVPCPRSTQSVRVVVEDQNGGRIGTAELDRKSIDAAPETPTPQPRLVPQPQAQASPNPAPTAP